ncbi:hypothetical protein ITG09_18180 [Vibrio cyclitrophicus]|nr:hypothetical protein [Vibrio cyclitrophicus]UPR54877.1 hypothetical protein ITG09_18180 [Vibrio cyclitrophicus]
MDFIKFWTMRLKYNFLGVTVSLFRDLLRELLHFIVVLASHPVATFIIIVMQLILGALLGVQFSGIDFGLGSSEPVYMWALSIWERLDDGVKDYSLIVLFFSLFKALCEAYNSRLARISEKKRLESERLIASDQWFTDSYVKAVRKVLDYKYLIDNKQKNSLEVIQDSLGIVRKLAAEYEGLNNDTISINLMLIMLTDEVEEQIAHHWQDCSMFFDGSSAKAAVAQIDGILTPIAVAHKKEVKLYIGDLEKCKKPHKPLLLPIVEDYECAGKTPQRVIGAPRAFSSGVYQYYPCFLRGVEDWLYKEQKRYISHNQADLLYKYYVQDDSARSLLSVPIESIYEQVDENNTVIEERSTNLVMNIYAGHEKLLRGNPSVFLSLAQPMLDTISYALDSWMLELEVENVQPENDDSSSSLSYTRTKDEER